MYYMYSLKCLKVVAIYIYIYIYIYSPKCLKAVVIEIKQVYLECVMNFQILILSPHISTIRYCYSGPLFNVS